MYKLIPSSVGFDGSQVLRTFLGNGDGTVTLAGSSPFFPTSVLNLRAADLFPGNSLEMFVVDNQGFVYVLQEVP